MTVQVKLHVYENYYYLSVESAMSSLSITVNGEIFSGLNFHRFHPIKFSRENFRGALHLKYLANQRSL